MIADRRVRPDALGLEGASNAIPEADDVTLEVLNVADRTIADGRDIARRPVATRLDAIFSVDDLLALGIVQVLVFEPFLVVPQRSGGPIGALQASGSVVIGSVCENPRRYLIVTICV